MRLQGGCKCSYCERKLESEDYGKGEQDVEHFRPKGRVQPWRPSTSLQNAGVRVTLPPSTAPGYHLLPYDLFNYSAACKPCNSALKADRFPIAGAYQFNGTQPEALLAVEQPLLIYPLGDFDADPEALIGFHGISPMALQASGHERHRALVTIEFFKLDSATERKNLLRERAWVIMALYPQLEAIRLGTAVPITLRVVQLSTADNSPHANCARSYQRLHGRDPQEAQRVFEAAAAWVDSSS